MVRSLSQILGKLFALALGMTACAPSVSVPVTTGSVAEPEPPKTRQVIHVMGETTVPFAPTRVVALDPAALDTAIAVGIMPIGAAGFYNDLPIYLGEIRKSIKIVGTPSQPDLETIAALKPDPIITTRVRHEAIYDKLSVIAPTVFAPDSGDAKTWKDNVTIYANALGKSERGVLVLRVYEQRVAQLKQTVAKTPDRTLSMILVNPSNPSLQLKSGFLGGVLTDVGVPRPAEQDIEGTTKSISLEVLNRADGVVIFWIQYNPDDANPPQKMMASALWAQLGAVKSGQTYQVSNDTWIYGRSILAANAILDDLVRFYVVK